MVIVYTVIICITFYLFQKILLKDHKKYNYSNLKYSAHCFGHIDQRFASVSSIFDSSSVLCTV